MAPPPPGCLDGCLLSAQFIRKPVGLLIIFTVRRKKLLCSSLPKSAVLLFSKEHRKWIPFGLAILITGAALRYLGLFSVYYSNTTPIKLPYFLFYFFSFRVFSVFKEQMGSLLSWAVYHIAAPNRRSVCCFSNAESVRVLWERGHIRLSTGPQRSVGDSSAQLCVVCHASRTAGNQRGCSRDGPGFLKVYMRPVRQLDEVIFRINVNQWSHGFEVCLAARISSPWPRGRPLHPDSFSQPIWLHLLHC